MQKYFWFISAETTPIHSDSTEQKAANDCSLFGLNAFWNFKCSATLMKSGPSWLQPKEELLIAAGTNMHVKISQEFANKVSTLGKLGSSHPAFVFSRWSTKRPGVATTTCGRLARAIAWSISHSEKRDCEGMGCLGQFLSQTLWNILQKIRFYVCLWGTQ